MRVLSDLSQRPRRAHIPASRVYVQRDPAFEISPEGLLPISKAVERDLAMPGSIDAPAPEPRPTALYLAEDQAPDAPSYVVLERSSGLALARVRGTLSWVTREIEQFVWERGGALEDVIIKLEH